MNNRDNWVDISTIQWNLILIGSIYEHFFLNGGEVYDIALVLCFILKYIIAYYHVTLGHSGYLYMSSQYIWIYTIHIS